MFPSEDLHPMLATVPEVAPPLVDSRLAYEPKYDGIRAVVLVEPGPVPAVRLWSRNGNEKSRQFPELVAALSAWAATLEAPVVLDGEIVALDAQGEPAGFQQLQGRINVAVPGVRSAAPRQTAAEQPAALLVFDLLRDGAMDWRKRPLRDRRAALEARCAGFASPLLRVGRQVVGDGSALYEEMRASGGEGLLVKRLDSPYRSGRRGPEWRKLKIAQQDEFVVAGWTDPKGARHGFGALMLGARAADGTLAYVGDVGTGFSGAEIDRVTALLDELATNRCPFPVTPKSPSKAHWVRPLLVAQIRYSEMTEEGRLRHPIYLGLRDDTPARAVTMPRTTSTSGTRAKRSRTRGAAKTSGDPLAGWEASAEAIVAQIDDLEARRKDGRITLPDGETLDITNPHKVFWPQGRRTKADLLRYYARVAPVLLPVLDDRPLVMKRLPNGVDGQWFYQHRAPEPVPSGVRIETLPDDDVPARIIGGSLKTLLYMAQLASISMDPFFSTLSALHTPDQVAIDLDPQPGATFAQILDVARWTHDVLDAVGVGGFPKTSGAEGLHIYVPLAPGTPYQAGMLFCQIVATMVATAHPKVATVERTVGRRRDGTIYVDYLQNIEGKTLACAYSARGSAFAGVSTPLTWAEVHAGVRPQDFTLDTILPRVRQAGDLWAPLREHPGADLLAALEKIR